MPSENVSLTEQQARFIRESVEAGRYQDASEVVRAGLRLLQDWQAERQMREAELRSMLDEAEAAGVSERTPEEIWASVESRYAAPDA
jgi:antitoxin ParD1/3/4